MQKIFGILVPAILLSCALSPTRGPSSELKARFSDDEYHCAEFVSEASAEQKEIIQESMANHLRRVINYLWTTTRQNWESLSYRDQSALKRLSVAWGQNAPLCSADYLSGEEFLLYHHTVNQELKKHLLSRQKATPCLSSFDKAHDFKNLGSNKAGSRFDFFQTNDGTQMIDVWLEKLAPGSKTREEFLTKNSLGFVGHVIEFSIFRGLMSRMAEPESQVNSPFFGGKVGKSILKPHPDFDAPEVNWLGNSFSAIANPKYWKVLNWLDDLILDWLVAHGKTEISTRCSNDASCYEWKSKWIGALSMPLASKNGKNYFFQGEVRASATTAIQLLSRSYYRSTKDVQSESAASRVKEQDILFDPISYIERYGPCPAAKPTAGSQQNSRVN